MDKYYVREYIPGYTGHISKKMGTFGMTAGEINRQLVLNKKVEEGVPAERLYYTNPQLGIMSPDRDHVKYGNRSRCGVSWISGPTDKVFAQHIPRSSGP